MDIQVGKLQTCRIYFYVGLPCGCFVEVFIDVLYECIYIILIWNTSGLIKKNLLSFIFYVLSI